MTIFDVPNPTPVQLALARWFYDMEMDAERQVTRARRYYAGDHDTQLSDRLLEFLGFSLTRQTNLTAVEARFDLNMCRGVNVSVAEKLLVRGADSTELAVETVNPETHKSELIKPQAKWAWSVWEENAMDAKHYDVHEAAVRDGESFLIVSWDNEEKKIIFTPQLRYTDVQAGGDGFGCKAHYLNDDPNQKLLAVSKRWMKYGGAGDGAQRLTVYYPDRIEKYKSNGPDWDKVTDKPGEQWPIPWVYPKGHAKEGKGLGIPVIHFKNRGLRIEAWDAFPIQDALNKSLIDLVVSADLTGFSIFKAFGFQLPTTDGLPLKSDGSNAFRIAPGMVVGAPKGPNDASFDKIEASDMKPLIELVNSYMFWIAVVTDTPLSRLQMTKLIASDQTLKQQEGPLISKCRIVRALFDDAWRKVFTMARLLHNIYGDETKLLDESIRIFPKWEPLDVHTDKEDVEVLAGKQKLHVPDEQIWRELGYDDETIKGFDEMLKRQQARAVQSAKDMAAATGKLTPGGSTPAPTPKADDGGMQPKSQGA